jgi:preprotein translocase subunit SecG
VPPYRLLVKLHEPVDLVDKIADLVKERKFGRASLPSLLVYTVLSIIQALIALLVIFLVLLHSGKDAGLSGAFGIGGGGSSFGGGSMVERNLDRATVFFSVLFVVNTLVLLKL